MFNNNGEKKVVNDKNVDGKQKAEYHNKVSDKKCDYKTFEKVNLKVNKISNFNKQVEEKLSGTYLQIRVKSPSPDRHQTIQPSKPCSTPPVRSPYNQNHLYYNEGGYKNVVEKKLPPTNFSQPPNMSKPNLGKMDEYQEHGGAKFEGKKKVNEEYANLHILHIKMNKC